MLIVEPIVLEAMLSVAVVIIAVGLTEEEVEAGVAVKIAAVTGAGVLLDVVVVVRVVITSQAKVAVYIL